MTDKEIIKAVECCKLSGNTNCRECPLLKNLKCKEVLHNEMLGLINRQQIAIKEFQKTISKLHEEIADLEAEIDKQYEQAVADIKGNIADGGTSCHWCIDRNKEEAIKEFAEKLKDYVFESNYGGANYEEVVVMEDVNNLVKEMTGDKDGKYV